MASSISISKSGVSLLLLIVAIVLFVIAAVGVGDKLGFNLVDLGLAALAASFIF